MKEIISKVVNGKKAQLMLNSNYELIILYNNECIDKYDKKLWHNINGEDWILQSLIDFSVNDYNNINNEEFSKLTDMLD